VGVNVGIMDQFTALHGQEGKCLFLDCRDLAFEGVPLITDVVKVIVCDTTVRHQLAGSEYNKRRAECEEGVAVIRQQMPNVKSLRDVAVESLPDFASEMPPVVFKRVKHVVTENLRVEVAVQALKQHNFIQFGICMDASHESLKDDYEVSCPELDTMVEIAWEQKGIYGARMTGGGFGGCTVNLVPEERCKAFCKQIAARYEERTGLKPGVYVCSSAPSAQVLGADDV
jgi:galactokinase